MPDCSSLLKLGERATAFKAAFSMAQRSIIADIALTSGREMPETGAHRRDLREHRQTLLPPSRNRDGERISKFRHAESTEVGPPAGGGMVSIRLAGKSFLDKHPSLLF
jgi:hypothetical protein